MREGDAELPVLEDLAQAGVGVVEVEGDVHVAGVGRLQFDDGVPAGGLVVDGVGAVGVVVEVPRVEVVVAVDGVGEHGLDVGDDVVADLVDVGQLAAFFIHFVVVGVALEHRVVGVGDGLLADPREEGRQVRVLPHEVPEVAQGGEAGDPAVVALGDRLVVGRGVVVDVELLEVVAGVEGEALPGGAAGHVLFEQRLGAVEAEDEGVVVDDLEFAGLAVGAEQFGRDALGDVGVEVDVVVGELDVGGGQGLAVGPPDALAERDGELRGVRVGLEGRGEVEFGLLPVAGALEQRLVGDGAPQPGAVGGAGDGGVPGAAVDADRLGGRDDDGLLGEALLDRGEVAGLDALGEHRGLGALVAAATAVRVGVGGEEAASGGGGGQGRAARDDQAAAGEGGVGPRHGAGPLIAGSLRRVIGLGVASAHRRALLPESVAAVGRPRGFGGVRSTHRAPKALAKVPELIRKLSVTSVRLRQHQNSVKPGEPEALLRYGHEWQSYSSDHPPVKTETFGAFWIH